MPYNSLQMQTRTAERVMKSGNEYERLKDIVAPTDLANNGFGDTSWHLQLLEVPSHH